MNEETLLGCKVRSGRAAAVVLAAGAEPSRVLDCRTLSLADPDDPATTQPYHAGFGSLEENEARIAPRLEAVARAARSSVAEALADWTSRDLPVASAALVVGSLTDPASVRHPHMRAHALEGRLFRTVLSDALSAHGITTVLFPERELYAEATTALGTSLDALKRTLSALRRSASGSWSTDHRLAAAAALALAARTSGRTGRTRRGVGS